nr:translation initiation factor IF-2-like [Aegilops tauschii subsp. strangulata]
MNPPSPAPLPPSQPAQARARPARAPLTVPSPGSLRPRAGALPPSFAPRLLLPARAPEPAARPRAAHASPSNPAADPRSAAPFADFACAGHRGPRRPHRPASAPPPPRAGAPLRPAASRRHTCPAAMDAGARSPDLLRATRSSSSRIRPGWIRCTSPPIQTPPPVSFISISEPRDPVSREV